MAFASRDIRFKDPDFCKMMGYPAPPKMEEPKRATDTNPDRQKQRGRKERNRSGRPRKMHKTSLSHWDQARTRLTVCSWSPTFGTFMQARETIIGSDMTQQPKYPNLTVEEGEKIMYLSRVDFVNTYHWLARNQHGQIGWVPACKMDVLTTCYMDTQEEMDTTRDQRTPAQTATIRDKKTRGEIETGKDQKTADKPDTSKEWKTETTGHQEPYDLQTEAKESKRTLQSTDIPQREFFQSSFNYAIISAASLTSFQRFPVYMFFRRLY